MTGNSFNKFPALVQIMACRQPGDKPLSEPMMESLLMHICVTRPQWVNDWKLIEGYEVEVLVGIVAPDVFVFQHQVISSNTPVPRLLCSFSVIKNVLFNGATLRFQIHFEDQNDLCIL